VFNPLSYEGAVDIAATLDPVQQKAQWDIVRNFGQTPQRLFDRPHPGLVLFSLFFFSFVHYLSS
jgi:hypothetical protein